MTENNTPQANTQQREATFDFSVTFNKYKRYWWLFAISVIGCLFVSYLYLKVTKPLYMVNAKILVANDASQSSDIGGSLIKSLGIGSGSDVNNEVEVVSSYTICYEMIKELKLNRFYTEKLSLFKSIDHYNNSPIEVNAPDALFDTLSTFMKFSIDVEEGGKDIKVKVTRKRFETLAEVKADKFPVVVETPFGKYTVDATKYYNPEKSYDIRAIVTGNGPQAEQYVDALTIGMVSKRSSVVSMIVDETNIQRGKDVLNKIIEIYNRRGEIEKSQTALNTGKFIDDRLAVISADLKNVETEIENFKKSNKIVSPEAEAAMLVQSDKNSEVAINQAETELSVLNMIHDFIKQSNNNHSLIPFTAEFSAVSSAIQQYNDLILKRQQMSYSAKGDNIALQSLDEQLGHLRSNISSSINSSIASTKLRINGLRNNMSKENGRLMSLPTQERQYLELQRQQAIKSELYNLLLQKREENELFMTATTPKGKVIDYAWANSAPIAPRKMLTWAMGLFFGLIIPILILYIKSLFSNKFATQDELSQYTQSPILGEVCHNRHGDALVVKPQKSSSIVELFRLIRNNIQFMLPSSDDKVILVSSSVSGEGKSFISANIAASFALLDKKTVLVGMDIRSPQLAAYFDLKSSFGATNYLSDNSKSVDDVLQSTDFENLWILPSGPIPPNPGELLMRPRVQEMFEELRKRFDYIIVDSAPICLVSDTLSISKYCDMTLFVTRANYTSSKDLAYYNEMIEKGQLKNGAVVINDTNPNMSKGYGYGYGAKSNNAEE